jgi:hypothetical protein
MAGAMRLVPLVRRLAPHRLPPWVPQAVGMLLVGLAGMGIILTVALELQATAYSWRAARYPPPLTGLKRRP